jgi:hypothetical protein
MFIFNKENGTPSQRNIPFKNQKSSLIWTNLLQTNPFSKGSGKKLVVGSLSERYKI